MTPCPLLLAAAKSGSIAPVLVWLAVLIAAAIVLGMVILFLRRVMLSKDSGSEAQSGLMASLREMRNRGELSAEEYDIARKRMAARAAGRNPDAVPAPRPAPAAPGERRSKPGFDLTGAPLPKPGDRPAPPR